MTTKATETTPLLNGCIVNIPKEKDVDLPFCGNLMKGLGLEELLPYDNDPWWQNLRKLMMIVFWTSVFVTFAAACIIALFDYSHGYCAARSNLIKSQIGQGQPGPNNLNASLAQLLDHVTSKVRDSIP